jgi:hypothetical protein
VLVQNVQAVQTFKPSDRGDPKRFEPFDFAQDKLRVAVERLVRQSPPQDGSAPTFMAETDQPQIAWLKRFELFIPLRLFAQTEVVAPHHLDSFHVLHRERSFA